MKIEPLLYLPTGKLPREKKDRWNIHDWSCYSSYFVLTFKQDVTEEPGTPVRKNKSGDAQFKYKIETQKIFLNPRPI